MEFLRTHQLDIMLFMSGICGVLAVLSLLPVTLSRKRRRIIALMELAAMFLLIYDRYAYIYRGDESTDGFYMVRISNFLVYLLILYIPHAITLFLSDLLRNEGKLVKLPKRQYICELLFAVGVALLVISQFTGLYYTFDAHNLYHRSHWNILCYVVPFIITILEITIAVKYRDILGRAITTAFVLNGALPLVAAVIQVFTYGVSLINMTIVGMAIVMYVIVLAEMNSTVDQARLREIEFYKEEQRKVQELFEQTAEALASAIDAKDRYTHGHSNRVAVYSQQIARMAGCSEEEANQVYFAALLHDVGKIGIADSIINKDGKLTDEEYEQIKLHPVYGNQILSRIQESPYLSIAAHHHHERYDGKGYPDGLKGEDIPKIARIVGVADAYDAMTSKRSYRDPIPQDKVREELVKGMGTQFDPEFAKIMLHLIDMDTEYLMQERETGDNLSIKTDLDCDGVGNDYTTGICIVDRKTHISFLAKPMDGHAEDGMPALIAFDSLDGRIHDTEAKKKDLLYLEYAKILWDGSVISEKTRNVETKTLPHGYLSTPESGKKPPRRMVRYEIEAVRYDDHLMVRIADSSQTYQTIIALPDSSHYTYLSVTGKYCVIRNIRVKQEEEYISEDYIPRIAERISFIKDCPQGDIPNVQIDRWRSAATKAIPVDGDIRIRFHATSLPTARLVWHCPFVCVYTSEDHKINGKGFREFAFIRLDGENWESDANATNQVVINRSSEFPGWNEWKTIFRNGIDCEVSIMREGNQVIVFTNNLGIAIRCTTTIHDDVEHIYAALTGDQCTITNIRIETVKKDV